MLLVLRCNEEIMANRRILYRVTIVLLIILLSVQYFYINPIYKMPAASPSQPSRKSQQQLMSLFFFKTGNKQESNVLLESATEDQLNGVRGDRLPPPVVSSKSAPSSSVPSAQALKSSGLPATNNSLSSSPSSSPLNLSHPVVNGIQSLQQRNVDCHNATNSTLDTVQAAQVYCPVPPPTLKGFLDVHLEAPPSLQIISRMHPDLDLGGHYKPSTCKAREKVAIVVPFRDREEHLRIFMYNIHPVLKRQMLEYNIFVIEQAGSEPFNRAMLFNVGFVEALKRDNFDCFIFHDVDLIPENDRNLYSCPIQPRHMSVAIDKMKYQLPYKTLFGGISALRTEHFKLVNGFSNVFWGWGAEDDDMANRIAYRGLYISRPSPDVARYKMLKHKHQKLNNNRYKMLLKGKQRFNVDGLSNLNYTVEQIILEKLFTLIRVQLIRVGDG